MANPSPDQTTGHEHDQSQDERVRAERGDTAAANQVVDGVLSAKQMMEGMGQPFTEVVLREALQLGKFTELSDKERAYAQQRLRKEFNVEVPTELRVDERVLPAPVAPPERRAAEALPDPEAERAELIRLAVEEVQRQFERAQADRAAFSIEAVLEDFKDTLGEEGLSAVRERLAAAGVTDLVEGGAAPAGQVISGRPPAPEGRSGRGRFDARTVRFSYDGASGGFTEEFEEEFGDGSRETRKRPLTLLTLPDNAKRVAEDPAKLTQLLERMQEIYRAAAVVPLYIQKDRFGKAVELYAEFKYARPRERVVLSLDEVEGEMLDIMAQDDNYSRAGAYQAYARPIQQRLRRAYMARKGAEAVSRLLGEPVRPASASRAAEPAVPGKAAEAPPVPERKVPVLEAAGIKPEEVEGLKKELLATLTAEYKRQFKAEDSAIPDAVADYNAGALAKRNLDMAWDDFLVEEAKRLATTAEAPKK